jgi:hypothetical protein
MPDKWAQYAVQPSQSSGDDKWAQYAQPSPSASTGMQQPQPGILDSMSAGLHSLTDNRDDEGFLKNAGRHALGAVLSPMTAGVDILRDPEHGAGTVLAG